MEVEYRDPVHFNEDGRAEPADKKRIGIGIGIASSGRLCPIEWATYMALQSYPVGTSTSWIQTCGMSIDEAREFIVAKALKEKLEYLWFVDDDTVPPFDAARLLFYELQQEKAKGSKVMVCGGIYVCKQAPACPLVFRAPGAGPYWDWKVGTVFPCWGIGTGCMMINMEVFKHLEPPYFKTSSEVLKNETDDLYFCAKVNDAGFKVLAHGGVLCSHWDIPALSRSPSVWRMPKSSVPFQE